MGGRVLNKHMLNTVTLHRRWGPMMSMCSAGLRESAWQRKATPHCVQLSFVASCRESQTQEFCALFSSSPAFVPSTWAIVWLSCEVSVSPWSSFSAIYVSQWTFLLRFEEAEWFVQWSAHSQLCICSSIHGCHQERTWQIPKSFTLTEEKNQCCVLALRKNECSKK